MASSSNEFSNVSLAGETVAQKAYTIGGVPIIFPYKAYPSQISMMDKMVRCLNKKHNCLLESPTGSGKSLALLCAALAWLKKTGKEIREMESVLNKHLNAYGAAVADDANCDVESARKSLPDFEKYKFKNHNSSDKSNVKPEVSIESEISGNSMRHVASELTCNKSFDSTASESSVKTPSSDEKLRIVTEKLRIKYPNPQNQANAGDHLKKRGIIYIDLDDDLKDFQPIKKHRLFPDVQETIPTATSQEECICPTPGAELSVQQEHQYGRKQSETPNNNSSGYASSSKVIPENSANNSLPTKLPKIYFGTRTHKQIGQIIRELKKTPYKDVKMTILSSRERTCVHPKNSKSNNKNEGCDELINRDGGPACNYYKNVKKLCYYSPPELSSAFDLEDFVSVCKKKQICPYYGAREILQNSEIVFCPYNYLVDPLIRSALSISLKNNVVIMDEAHNIEDSAREAASGCISVSQLQEAIADVLQIGQLKDSEESEPYMHIAKVLENLKKLLENSENLNEYVSFDSSSKVYSGDDMLAFLSYVGLGPDTFPIFQNHYTKICHDESETEKEKTAEIKIPKLSGRTHIHLKNLTVILNYMFKEKLVYVPDYRCVVIKSKSYSSDTSVIPFSQTSKRKSFASAFEITINFWCLNPAVAFSDMKNIHSLIVASGTLAPLTSFQSELGITFHVTLEANHVISKEQVWVGTIGKGPSNNPLNGTFQNASTFAYQDDVGNLVLEVCSVIPHGVLCFLPSYGMLDKLASRWQVTGLWDQLLCKKVVVCEPRGANANFLQVMQEFYDAVKDSETDGCGEVTGALFFAVCRGKVSEGLDFADNNARAVITIGIPFPNVKDAHVDLKKKYNDMYASKRQIVTGSAWYEMQAFRALNQALGRCIRHRNDFGALIIVDERFQKYDRYISALSKWMRREIRHYPSFYDALNSLSSFAARMGLKNASISA